MSKSLPCSREVPSTAEPPLDLTQSCLAGMSGSFQQTPWAESPSGCAAQAPSPCCALCACAQGWAGPSAQLQGCTWALLSLDNVENHVLPWPLNKAQTLSSSIPLPLSPAGSLLPGSWHCLELQDYSSHPQIHLQGDQTPFLPHFFSLGTPRHFLPTTGINIFSRFCPTAERICFDVAAKAFPIQQENPQEGCGSRTGRCWQHPWGPAPEQPPEGLELSRDGFSWGEGSPVSPSPA